MKKILLLFVGICFLMCSLSLPVFATETTVVGEGVAALTGYDIGATREQEDEYMAGKAHKSKTEFMHTQQIKEASRQAEKRKKEDKRMSQTVRAAVVTAARERADRAAINLLIDRTLGAGASKAPEVVARINDIYSQVNTFAINKEYTGQVIDNNYVAKVTLTVEDSDFRELLTDLEMAINTDNVRAHSILIVMDEFFGAPSDMHSNTLLKEVTTYDYKYNEKDSERTKASASATAASMSAGGYSGIYGAAGSKSASKAHASANYSNAVDHSRNESEFFQTIKEYTPKNPVVQNHSATKASLEKAFVKSDIRTINEQMFRSKYFKGKPINADQLQNSEELAKYIKYAQTDAKADFFAIGVATIVDRGVDESTGYRAADGVVIMAVYSTEDGETIAHSEFKDSGSGNTADTARADVARKLGIGAGDDLAKQIQKYYNRRKMYGQEYIVEIKGNFLPAERISIDNSLNSADGMKATRRSADNTKLEYVIKYKGQNNTAGDVIFMQLMNASSKFNKYNYVQKQNHFIYSPI